VTTATLCPHLRAAETCWQCAARELRELMPQLFDAITAARSSAVREVAVTGGSPSWEPINLAAMSLRQDITNAGGIYRAGGRPNSHVVGWRNRARIILGLAFAPQTIMRDAETVQLPDGHTVVRARPASCPVDDCTGRLQLHRESDPRSSEYGKPLIIRCSGDAQHQWSYREGGFLRLKVALERAAAKAVVESNA
jgi:CO/xanthine dehydrogenase FAD-binding subunit